MAIIHFKDLWEMFRIKFVIDGKISWENFWALKGISFEVEKGETLGIVGENGAGKSTILKLIAGMLRPDRGEINVKGRVSGLLELGAGFQLELTGRENIYLIASLYGLNQTEIEKRYDKIADFASIGKFIHASVKCYSQGMFVRLAFSIAIHMDAEILLIDDTLAVGDEYFQRKCIKKIFELKEQGKTILFVTHDMNMLRRLCKRAIFLKEGRIVKDDSTDKVTPLYTQMLGERQGVGVLEKKPLNLIFNNGRLFLNWQDKLLTPNSGAYASFLISGKWYSSFQADWDVNKESENKLLATGKFYQLALTQTWRLEITNDYEIKWDIEIDLQESLEIQEGNTNIMLTNEYNQWFTNSEKGEFPLIEYKDKNWQWLLEGNPCRRCIGVGKRETSNGEIPSLAFEQFNYTSAIRAQILNTDYLINSRVLQYKILGLQNYLATQTNRFIYFSGGIILNIPDIEHYLNHLEDEISLFNGKLKLVFDNGQCILSYDGITLTKANHMNTSIYVNGKWYSSNLAHWDVKKQGKDKVIATGNWLGLPLTQIWEVEITNENSFSWKVSMKVKEELNIEQQHIYVTACNDYMHWFSDYGAGKFPGNFLEVNTDILQKCIPEGLVGIKDQNAQLPTVSLRFSKELNNFAKIFNSDFYNKARILRIDKVESEQNIKFLPGHYPCFAIEAVLGKDKQVYKDDSINMLQGARLRFVFDNGSGRIFWNEQNLTKRLGLYTSLRSQGRWYDSTTSALWNIENKNNNSIKIVGRWLHLPIKQFWEVSLKEDKFIEFIVNMQVDKEIEVDRLQTNLMLSERYLQWITNKENGTFPLFKDNVNDDWDCIWSGQNPSAYIGTLENIESKNSLPSVILSPQALNSDWRLNLINSDIYHRGRVLQYLNSRKIKLPPGEYPYFNGKIIIEV